MLGKPHTQIAILDDDPVSVITPLSLPRYYLRALSSASYSATFIQTQLAEGVFTPVGYSAGNR